MQRTLKNLSKELKGDVYVWLRDAQTGERFLRDAEQEGFMIGNEKPTAKPHAQVMALQDDAICYVGTNGMLRFGCGDTADFHCVDYEKYVSCAADYGFRKTDDRPQIHVRPYAEKDFEALFRLAIESSVLRLFQDKSLLPIVQSAVRKEYIESGDEQFSIIRNSDEMYCGNISLRQDENGLYELGIAIVDVFQNQGFGTEALRQFCDYCYRERGIQRLLVRIDPDNSRSIHVFEKLGAVFLKKKASYILKRTYEQLGKPLPEDLDETSGVLNYELQLPLVV